MLKQLSIKNYALIESAEVEFQSGLNILTGETGAGKSILLDALSLILGDRASTEGIRKGTEKAVVEGLFGIAANAKVQAILQEQDIEIFDELILRREVSAKGQSRCFVNDSPVPLTVMKQIGDFLVDLHGQHEHQSLLRTETHIDLLDEFGGLEGLVEEYRRSYLSLLALLHQHRDLRQKEQVLKEKRSIYEFQLNEIDTVDPQPDEDETLENELRILENAEKLYDATEQLHHMLYEGDQSVYDVLVKARNQLQDLAEIDTAFEESKNECASAAAIISELTKFLQNYNAKVEFQPERLEEIRGRLGQIALLKKKYGGSLKAVIAHREAIGKEFAIAEHYDAELEKLQSAIDAARALCAAAAERLSAKRRELAPTIASSVCAELATLGIPHAQFEVRIENEPLSQTPEADDESFIKLGKQKIKAGAKGIDTVEFFLSTNIGEDVKPLAKVASGGEISRIMLALKTILAKADRLPLLVFDEIDVGISGRIAQAVGKSMKHLSEFHQIISITHLPQIAGLADSHFMVAKSESKNRTVSSIKRLPEKERIYEVARMLSGEDVTDAGLSSARELMGLRQQ